jgi:hypothetical protein
MGDPSYRSKIIFFRLKFGEILPQKYNGDKDWDVKGQIEGPMGKQK